MKIPKVLLSKRILGLEPTYYKSRTLYLPNWNLQEAKVRPEDNENVHPGPLLDTLRSAGDSLYKANLKRASFFLFLPQEPWQGGCLASCALQAQGLSLCALVCSGV